MTSSDHICSGPAHTTKKILKCLGNWSSKAFATYTQTETQREQKRERESEKERERENKKTTTNKRYTGRDK